MGAQGPRGAPSHEDEGGETTATRTPRCTLLSSHALSPLTPSLLSLPFLSLLAAQILNGRLAMIAIVGFYAQLKVTGHIWPLI